MTEMMLSSWKEISWLSSMRRCRLVKGIKYQVCAADASPLQWEGLTGVPLDTDDNVSFILFGSPTFAKIDDLLRGDD